MDQKRRIELEKCNQSVPETLEEAEYLEALLQTRIETIDLQIERWMDGRREGSEDWVFRAKTSRRMTNRRLVSVRQLRFEFLRDKSNGEDSQSLSKHVKKLERKLKSQEGIINSLRSENNNLTTSRDRIIEKTHRHTERVEIELKTAKRFVAKNMPDKLEALYEAIDAQSSG